MGDDDSDIDSPEQDGPFDAQVADNRSPNRLKNLLKKDDSAQREDRFRQQRFSPVKSNHQQESQAMPQKSVLSPPIENNQYLGELLNSNAGQKRI